MQPQIKNPKTNRYINIGGDTYKKLITTKQYTEEYLLSLPKKQTKQISSYFPLALVDDDTVFNIALNLHFLALSKLCQVDKRYNRIICDNENFWKYKYEKDLKNELIRVYNKEVEHLKWFKGEIQSYDNYVKDMFEIDDGTWKRFYSDAFYTIMNDYTLYIMNRFDIRKKYEEKYDNIQNYITR